MQEVLAGALSPRRHSDQTPNLGHLVSFLGQGRKIRSISTLDLPSYKRRLSWDNMALPIDWIFTSV
jgi:hypothetical protein